MTYSPTDVTIWKYLEGPALLKEVGCWEYNLWKLHFPLYALSLFSGQNKVSTHFCYHIMFNTVFWAMEPDGYTPKPQKSQTSIYLLPFKLLLLFNHSNTKTIRTENWYQEMRLLQWLYQAYDSELFRAEQFQSSEHSCCLVGDSLWSSGNQMLMKMLVVKMCTGDSR